MLNDAPYQPHKFRTKYCIEINDEARGNYKTNSKIKFKTSMLKPSLCDYRDVYILVGGTIVLAALEAGEWNNNVQVVFKNCAPFTDCIGEINNTQIDKAKNIDVVMPMYNLTEHSDKYSKTLESWWHYHRDEPALNDAGTLDNFPSNSASFKFKQKITGSASDDSTKNVEMMAPLTCLSNFWKSLEMPKINSVINLILNWS